LLVVLARLTRIEDSVVEEASSVLSRCLGMDVLVDLEVAQPPIVFYDWRRMQYRSDYILGWLAELHGRMPGDLLVALGDIDAYVPGLNFVFGHADPGRGVASVYLRRLRPSFYGVRGEVFEERAAKEVLHEVGHLLGLGHCSNKRCVMSFSNSVDEVDYKEPAFCRKCASTLRKHGINVGCILD